MIWHLSEWNVGVIEHRSTSSAWTGPFAITITARRWGLGFVVHEWGVRLLALKWHVCIHWPEGTSL